MDILIFENRIYFYLFFIIPVVVLLFSIALYYRKRALKSFGDEKVVMKLIPLFSYRRPYVKLGLIILALSLLIIAAVNPKIGSRMEEAKREGVDIVVAIDVSRSMLAEDIRPNRIERAKAAVSRLINNLGQDRIGVVAFAGNAVTQVPLTSDHSAARMLLRTIGTHSVSTQGTAIGSAISRAMLSFQDEDSNSKTIIIISDGESHMDEPVETARLAAAEGITIHTIGIGTPEGAPIPIYENNRMTGFLRDRDGNTVISRYDEQALRAIAEVTGGRFQHGAGADMGLNTILDEIRGMEKAEFESKVFADYESRYHYFVALTLLILLLELLIFERKNKWIDKINFFKES